MGGGRGIIFVSSAVVFREDNAPWEPQSWVQPTQKTRPGITVQRWLAFRPPVCLRASATSRFSPGRGEKGPKRCETKVSGKMVPLRENEGRRSEIAERLVIASAWFRFERFWGGYCNLFLPKGYIFWYLDRYTVICPFFFFLWKFLNLFDNDRK